MRSLNQYWDKFLGLFLRDRCCLCDRDCDDHLCTYCYQQVKQCQLSHPQKFWSGSDNLFVWGSYQGTLKRAIALLKYEQKPQLAEVLGDFLASTWLKSGLHHSNLLVIPIPMHPKKQQERGYNQADLLAETFCHITGLQLLKSGLSRVIDTVPLYQESSVKKRAEILNNAFVLGKNYAVNLQKKPVLLLDDIYTTGSTINEAKKVLKQRGIKVYGTVAVATPKV